MEGLACSMGPSGDCSVLEQRKEESNSSSAVISSSRGEYCEGAEGRPGPKRSAKIIGQRSKLTNC